jgi:hypothetical protein
MSEALALTSKDTPGGFALGNCQWGMWIASTVAQYYPQIAYDRPPYA